MGSVPPESPLAGWSKYDLSKLWRGRQISLRRLLLITFVGQILGIVSLIGYLSWRNGQKTANNLGGQIRQELTYRIEQELRRYFETPHEINRLNVAAFARGELDVIGGTFGEAQLYQQMKIAPNLAFVYCGSANSGEFFGVLRSPADGSLQLSYGNRSNDFFRDYYSLDVSGKRTFPLRRADKTFDARVRPWYYAAVSAEGPAWTPVYIAFTTGLPNITASLPVYDRSGSRLLGVCATDVVLPEEFRNFLRGLQIGENGQAFVIDRKGQLISNSTDEPLMVGEAENARSVLAVESQDPLVRSAAQYLVKQFGGLEQLEGKQQLQFALDGKLQFLEVVPFQDDFGLDWLIVVVVPEADFLGQVDANTRTTAALSIAAVSAAILLAILASRWITRPIMAVAASSELMAEGSPPQPVKLTAITEMQAMATAFNTMTARLHSTLSALRQSEDQNQALMAAIPDLLIRARRDGTYIEIMGKDRLQVHDPASFIAGTNVFASLPAPAAEQRMEAIRAALATGTLQLYEQQITIDDQTFYEEVRVMPFTEDQVLIMVRDITDRKRAEVGLRIAEENYRSIYENALEGIFQSGADGRFISVNPAMAEIYGYGSPEELMESIQNIRSQVYVDPKDEKTFTTEQKEHGEVIGFEYRVYRRDGSIIWVRENSRAVVDDNGVLLYYEGILQDITERKRIENDLRRQLEELRIEIDHQKLEQDVASITQSGYFQEIRAAIAEVDLDEFWK